MLRLLTSDLVLDEPDDFDLADLPALSRLVNWAGLLGSRLLLSSATLPPSLVQGLFEAYRTGRAVFQENRGIPGVPLLVPCAWFDEFRCEATDVTQQSEFRAMHDVFVDKRLSTLRKTERRRSALLVPISSNGTDRASTCAALAAQLPAWMSELHSAHHTVDPQTGKRASFGLVRMANIDPLITVARDLYALGTSAGTRVHLCVYHARHPLVIRSAIERLLDRALQRREAMQIFDDPSVRGALDANAELDHLFVVLASPVAEVGRDHDYDWAIIEPSSMRSIIQLAGRVRRHRPGACRTPNLFVLRKNLKALQGRRPAFEKPGFESLALQLTSYDLQVLLTEEQLSIIDAGSRIKERAPTNPTSNLVDLEHHSVRKLMLGDGISSTAYSVADWWKTPAALTGVLQRAQPFRKGALEETYALLPDEDDENRFVFAYRSDEWVRVPNLCHRVLLDQNDRVEPWGPTDYGSELGALASRLDQDLQLCARRYGAIRLRPTSQGWNYHPWLGWQTAS